MNKLWQVATFEFKRNVFKKSFLITLLSIPLFIVIIVGIGLFMESRGKDSQTVGVVDQGEGLQLTILLPEMQTIWADKYDKPTEFLAYKTAEEADAALNNKQLQAYYLLPENYVDTGQVEVIYAEEPAGSTWGQFYDLLRAGLLTDYPPIVIHRIAAGSNFAVRSIDGDREIPVNSGPTFGLLMPLLIALAMLALLLICSGYINTAVADEKENRTIEVLVTTISPLQLIGGKILGISAISLILLIGWTGMTGLGIFLARLAGVEWFSNLALDWGGIIATLAIGIPAYILATALMVAIGSMVTTTQESQSISSIFFILHLVPLYVSVAFLKAPHNPLALILSFMPFTSLMAVAMRNLLSVVPAWQVVISTLVQVVCAIGAIWLASRVFRLGMLHYGHRLKIQHMFMPGKKKEGGQHA